MAPIDRLDAPALRRIALHMQGLTERTPFGRGRPGAARAIERLGYVQIDTISVVARAHDHTLWARVPGYKPEHLSELVARREAFEYWFHAASFLPINDYRFALPRMRAMQREERRWFSAADIELMQRVLDRIKSEGALKTRSFEGARDNRSGWWDWRPAKRALEQLFRRGDLMVSSRDGFQKVYDLPERVLPSTIDTREPTFDELAAHLVDRTLSAHGFATLKTFTYQRRSNALRARVKLELEARQRAGTVGVYESPPVNGRRTLVYALPAALDASIRVPARVRVLSPFDNAVIQRDRNLHVHEFDYLLECYVEPDKRRFGYFCLPLLYRDRFVGIADCKAHRKEGVFEIKHLFIERPPADADGFFAALRDAIDDYAAFNGCTQIDVKRVSPRRWTAPARATFR